MFTCSRRGKWNRPPLRQEGVDDVVGQDAPEGATVLVDDHDRRAPRLDQLLGGHVRHFGVGPDGHGVVLLEQLAERLVGVGDGQREQADVVDVDPVVVDDGDGVDVAAVVGFAAQAVPR